LRAHLRAKNEIALNHPALPGLNHRSVRDLGHVRLIRSACQVTAAAGMLFAASIVAGFGVPAYAHSVSPSTAQVVHLQSFASPADAATPTVERDVYSVTAPPPLVWPVGAGAPIGSDFGPRVSPCAGCSSYHEGVDFDPGYGAQIHAVAAGVVVETDSPGYSALGVHVAIRHVIDGQVVVSAYGHMQVGSMPLHVGDAVTANEVIGLVGSTGASTGAHLHFEIRANGTTPIDPLAWMHARLG
jgi:murein DD-endopeptidase MepM/ murein hydrolase activator NlpD